MKKLLLFLIPCSLFLAPADAATPWWQQPTVCRLNPANCYAGMGMGFDDGMWDATANCWGIKMICGEALSPAGNSPIAIGKTTIVAGTGINPDFDTNVLNGDCFGSRKTTANGSMATVGGQSVKVWCNGVLNSADEILATGEITFGAQPTCATLSQNGYVAMLSGRCYGKFYDPNDYYIECTGTSEAPSRIVMLNGANHIVGASGGSYNYPTTESAAKAMFDMMQSVSATKRSEHF